MNDSETAAASDYSVSAMKDCKSVHAEVSGQSLSSGPNITGHFGDESLFRH